MSRERLFAYQKEHKIERPNTAIKALVLEALTPKVEALTPETPVKGSQFHPEDVAREVSKQTQGMALLTIYHIIQGARITQADFVRHFSGKACWWTKS